MSQPKISVCIPTYNYGRYISQAIDSILVQTFTDFELLVVDDSSSDSTDAILRRYASQDSRIRYIRHATNQGMVENWNYCLREARGQYIKFLFADDYFTSDETLGQMVSVLDSDESISIVGSARKFINKKTGTSKIVSFAEQNRVLDGGVVINLCLTTQHNLIGEPTAVMFRKDQAARGFDGRYRQLVDLEMWFHLLEQGRHYHIATPLCVFRIHGEQQTAKNAKEDVTLNDIFILYSEYLCKPYISISEYAKKYLIHEYYYRVWKSYYKHRRISFNDFSAKVSNYGLIRFFALYPVYRIYKTFNKLLRKVKR